MYLRVFFPLICNAICHLLFTPLLNLLHSCFGRRSQSALTLFLSSKEEREKEKEKDDDDDDDGSARLLVVDRPRRVLFRRRISHHGVQEQRGRRRRRRRRIGGAWRRDGDDGRRRMRRRRRRRRRLFSWRRVFARAPALGRVSPRARQIRTRPMATGRSAETAVETASGRGSIFRMDAVRRDELDGSRTRE